MEYYPIRWSDELYTFAIDVNQGHMYSIGSGWFFKLCHLEFVKQRIIIRSFGFDEEFEVLHHFPKLDNSVRNQVSLNFSDGIFRGFPPYTCAGKYSNSEMLTELCLAVHGSLNCGCDCILEWTSLKGYCRKKWTKLSPDANVTTWIYLWSFKTRTALSGKLALL